MNVAAILVMFDSICLIYSLFILLHNQITPQHSKEQFTFIILSDTAGQEFWKAVFRQFSGGAEAETLAGDTACLEKETVLSI